MEIMGDHGRSWELTLRQRRTTASHAVTAAIRTASLAASVLPRRAMRDARPWRKLSREEATRAIRLRPSSSSRL